MQRRPACRVGPRAAAAATATLQLELELIGLQRRRAGGAGHRAPAAAAAVRAEAAHGQRRRFAQACASAWAFESLGPWRERHGACAQPTLVRRASARSAVMVGAVACEGMWAMLSVGRGVAVTD